jgi:ABC-type multidrug transport system ATPase subunit
MAEGAFLEARGLSYSHPGAEFRAVDDLGFGIPKGSLLAICGENGSGKSTLLDLLAGHLEPSSGSILIDGREASKASSALRLLPQNIDYFLLGSTVEEEIGLSVGKGEGFREGVEALSNEWGFSGRLEDRVDSLSGGEKKRLALLGALASRPLAFFLDEPFSGLDWRSSESLASSLSLVKGSGETIILSTHDPGLVAPFTDYWLFLSRGKGHFFTGDRKALEGMFARFGVRPFPL